MASEPRTRSGVVSCRTENCQARVSISQRSFTESSWEPRSRFPMSRAEGLDANALTRSQKRESGPQPHGGLRSPSPNEWTGSEGLGRRRDVVKLTCAPHDPGGSFEDSMTNDFERIGDRREPLPSGAAAPADLETVRARLDEGQVRLKRFMGVDLAWRWAPWILTAVIGFVIFAVLLGFGSARTGTVALIALFAGATGLLLVSRFPGARFQRSWPDWWDRSQARPSSVRVASQLLGRSDPLSAWEARSVVAGQISLPTFTEWRTLRARPRSLEWAAPIALLALVLASVLPHGLTAARDDSPSSRRLAAQGDPRATRSSSTSERDASLPDSSLPDRSPGAIERGGPFARSNGAPSPLNSIRREAAARSAAAAQLSPIAELAPLAKWLLGEIDRAPDAPRRAPTPEEASRLSEAARELAGAGLTDVARWIEAWPSADDEPPPEGFSEGERWQQAMAELQSIDGSQLSAQFSDVSRADGGSEVGQKDRNPPGNTTESETSIASPTESLRLEPVARLEGERLPVDPPEFRSAAARSAWVDLWGNVEVEPRFLVIAQVYGNSRAKPNAKK